MADKYLFNNAGTLTEKAGLVTSGGAGDAGKIPALDSGGKLDNSLLPTGVGAETAVVSASEALSAGDFVNIWSSTGTFKVRRADGSTSGKEAHGFVLSAVLSGSNATVYLAGINNAVTGATPGPQFLSDSVAGGFVSTAPSGTGKTVQRLGVAVSATAIAFEPTEPIVLA
jgi:hypothetical protein